MDVLAYARRRFDALCPLRATGYTQVQLAWAAALGLRTDAALATADPEPDDRETRRLERLMRQRYGAMDRRR